MFDMIPRRFYWLLDFVTILIAFVLSDLCVPVLQKLLISNGLLQVDWIAALNPETDYTKEPATYMLWILLVAAPPTVLVMEVAGSYGQWVHKSLTKIMAAGILAPFTGYGVIAIILLTIRNPSLKLSRLFIFLFVLLTATGLILYRLILREYVRRRRAAGHYARNVVVIGLPWAIRWMERYFGENISPIEYRLLGQLTVSPDASEPATSLLAAQENVDSYPSLPPLGTAFDLGDLLIHKPIQEVIAIQSETEGGWIPKVIQDCDHFGILLRIVPEALLKGEMHRLQTLYAFQALHLPAVVLTPPHWDSDTAFIKRLFDIVVSSLLLLFLSPIFALIALAIKLTTPRLPVFYPWRVVGKNGVRFTGYKFTTMIADADERKAELMHLNEMTGPVFKIKYDPRVTPLGRFFRKYSLNELPQLWSVLKGDMSLVGPRPAGPHELERYEFWHKRKLSILPGITCLWQVRGRNRISNFDDWVRMDLEYIDHWSLWLDLKILIRTAWVVLSGTGS